MILCGLIVDSLWFDCRFFDCLLLFSRQVVSLESNTSFITLDSVTKCLLLFSCSVVTNSLRPHGLQHARLPSPSLYPRACSNSCPLDWRCHPTVLSSVDPFSSCLQSFPTSGSFLMSQLFTSSGQSIGVSPSVLPLNIQYWFPLGLTGLIYLHSKGVTLY